VKNPIVDTERDVVTEVVESSSLVLGLSERRLVRLGTHDVLKIGVDVGFIGKDDDLDGRVVLLEFDQFVVTTSNSGFVGSFRDENDEEVSNVFAVNLLAVHSGRSRCDIGSDEADPGEETVGEGEHPDDSPESRERQGVVRPLPSWVVNTPNRRHSRNDEEMGNPRPTLQVE